MIKALVLHGSPSKGGSSDTSAARSVEGLKTTSEVHVTEFYADDVHVRSCQGCLRCNWPPDY